MILLWGARWHARYWDIFSKAGSIGVMVCAIGMVGLFMRRLLRANTSKANEYMHGSARWASEKDIKGAALLDNDGVYVGGWLDRKTGSGIFATTARSTYCVTRRQEAGKALVWWSLRFSLGLIALL